MVAKFFGNSNFSDFLEIKSEINHCMKLNSTVEFLDLATQEFKSDLTRDHEFILR